MKRILSVLLVIAMVLSMAACGASGSNAPAEAPAPAAPAAPAETPAEAPAATETKTEPTTIELTDLLGNTVTIEPPYDRIGTCAWIASYLCICLGVSENIIITESGNVEAFPFYKALVKPEVLAGWQTAGGMKNLSIEGVIGFAPEFMILPTRQADAKAQLETVGIKCYVASPESADEVRHTLIDLGKAFGVEDRAQALVDFYDNVWADVEKRLSGLSEEDKPMVYMNGMGDLLNSVTPKMYQGELIKAAGGKLVSEDLGDTYWVKVSPEQMQVYNPEVILLAADSRFTPADWYADTSYSNLTAIKNEEVYLFPSTIDYWDTPSPTACLALVWLANQLHPELVPADVVEGYVTDYYSTFFGVDVTMESLGITLK